MISTAFNPSDLADTGPVWARGFGVLWLVIPYRLIRRMRPELAELDNI